MGFGPARVPPSRPASVYGRPVRILHTSDWHVGRRFHGHDLLPDQEHVLGAIADLVRAESVDVVVVAGDLYDRALPGVDAVRVCGRALARIAAAGARIVAISGNHDSASRLGFGADFLAAGGLHLRTDPAQVGEPVLLADEHGEVAFHPIPYLEPETTRQALGAPEARSHAGVVGAAMDAVRADLAGRPGVRSVVVAHAFVVGGELASSERSIAVGGVETVPAATFDGVDHVALGHLHGPQQPDPTRPWLRYSGSPLHYSFGEARQRKCVELVDLGASGPAEVRRVPLPVPRPLSTVTGELADLLADPSLADRTGHWIRAVLTDPVRPLDAMRRLQDRFPWAVDLVFRPPEGAGALDAPARVRAAASDLDLAADFVAYVRGGPPDDEERALLAAAFEAHRHLDAVR